MVRKLKNKIKSQARISQAPPPLFPKSALWYNWQQTLATVRSHCCVAFNVCPSLTQLATWRYLGTIEMCDNLGSSRRLVENGLQGVMPRQLQCHLLLSSRKVAVALSFATNVPNETNENDDNAIRGYILHFWLFWALVLLEGFSKTMAHAARGACICLINKFTTYFLAGCRC